MSDVEPGDTMIEALRRANPVPAEQTANRRSSPSAHALFAEIIEQRPRRVRTRVVIVVIAIVLIALMLAAFVTVRRGHASLPAGAACYSTASLDAPKRVVASADDPVTECAALWTAGQLGSGPVPHFDMCVLPSGVVGVFPGESGSVCGALHLPEQSGGEAMTDFADDVNRQVSAGCFNAKQAEQIVRSVLADHKLEGWTVKRSPEKYTNMRRCASLYIDATARSITLLPAPDPRATSTSAP